MIFWERETFDGLIAYTLDMGTGIHIERTAEVNWANHSEDEAILLYGLRGTKFEVPLYSLKSVTYIVADFGDNLWPIVCWMESRLGLSMDDNSGIVSRDSLEKLQSDLVYAKATPGMKPILFPVPESLLSWQDEEDSSEMWDDCFNCIEKIREILRLCPSQEVLTVVIAY